jgi:hypothetical protein
MRGCGECHFCCVIYEIDDPELKKWARSPCRYLRKCLGGCCSIHDNQPKICRDYACAWKDGVFLHKEERPDEIGAVFVTRVPDGRGRGFRVMAMAHAETPDIWDEGTPARKVAERLSKKMPVVLRPTPNKGSDKGSDIMGPWDDEGNVTDDQFVIDSEEAHRKKRVLTEEEKQQREAAIKELFGL